MLGITLGEVLVIVLILSFRIGIILLGVAILLRMCMPERFSAWQAVVYSRWSQWRAYRTSAKTR